MKLKELEDYEGFPKNLRQFQMDFIGIMTRLLHLYKPLVPMIETHLSKNRKRQIMDLCSGSGQPAIYIHQQLQKIEGTLLTDKFPQVINEIDRVIYVKHSVDILKMNFEAQYFYTMYNAFHHFTDEEQKEIVSKLSAAKASFLIVEILQPNLLSLLQVILASTLGQLLITPFIKPFSLTRLLFTYIIPINIFTVLYDGVISVIKSKSVKEYKKLLGNYINDGSQLVGEDTNQGDRNYMNKGRQLVGGDAIQGRYDQQLVGENTNQSNRNANQTNADIEIKTIFKFPTTLTYIQGTPTS
jgi:hypothetical protein